jgi:dTDP-4-dehydrorhamnose 3,5-epimerase-like enzyme
VQARPTRLDGLVALEPAVHGDERGLFVDTAAAPRLSAITDELPFQWHP